MRTTIYLPPVNDLTPEKTKSILRFLSENGFLVREVNRPVEIIDLRLHSPSRFSTNGNSKPEILHKALALAKTLGIPCAVHYDATDNKESKEWSQRSGINWFDPKTDKIHRAQASAEDATPCFEAESVLRWLKTPHLAKLNFIEPLESLQALGVFPEQYEPSEAEVNEYLQLKTNIRAENAESSASIRDEFKSVYRNGTPPVGFLNQQDLLEQIKEMKENEES